jgi:hypothetical protein
LFRSIVLQDRIFVDRICFSFHISCNMKWQSDFHHLHGRSKADDVCISCTSRCLSSASSPSMGEMLHPLRNLSTTICTDAFDIRPDLHHKTLKWCIGEDSLFTDIAFHLKWHIVPFNLLNLLPSGHVSFCRATINKMMAGRKSEKGLLIVA